MAELRTWAKSKFDRGPEPRRGGARRRATEEGTHPVGQGRRKGAEEGEGRRADHPPSGRETAGESVAAESTARRPRPVSESAVPVGSESGKFSADIGEDVIAAALESVEKQRDRPRPRSRRSAGRRRRGRSSSRCRARVEALEARARALDPGRSGARAHAPGRGGPGQRAQAGAARAGRGRPLRAGTRPERPAPGHRQPGPCARARRPDRQVGGPRRGRADDAQAARGHAGQAGPEGVQRAGAALRPAPARGHGPRGAGGPPAEHASAPRCSAASPSTTGWCGRRW